MLEKGRSYKVQSVGVACGFAIILLSGYILTFQLEWLGLGGRINGTPSRNDDDQDISADYEFLSHQTGFPSDEPEIRARVQAALREAKHRAIWRRHNAQFERGEDEDWKELDDIARKWRYRPRSLCPESTSTVRLVMPHVNKAGGRTISATFKPDQVVHRFVPLPRSKRVNITALSGHHTYEVMESLAEDDALVRALESRSKFAFLEHIPAYGAHGVCTRWMFFVRNPLARTISAFNTMVGRSRSKQRASITNHFYCSSPRVSDLMTNASFTIEDFARLSDEDRATCDLNYHLKYLAEETGPMTARLSLAKQRLSKMHFVGLTDEFATSMQLLSWELNLGLEWYAPLSNIKLASPSELSAHARSVLMDMLQPDFELFDFAVNNLYKLRLEAFREYFNGAFPWDETKGPSRCGEKTFCYNQLATGDNVRLYEPDEPTMQVWKKAVPGSVKALMLCFPAGGCRLDPVLYEEPAQLRKALREKTTKKSSPSRLPKVDENKESLIVEDHQVR